MAIEYENGTEFNEGLAKYVEYRLFQVLENRPRGTRAAGHGQGPLDLAEDLRLAEDHGIEAHGDAKQVPRSCQILEGIQAWLQLAERHIALRRQERPEPLRLGVSVALRGFLGLEDRFHER